MGYTVFALVLLVASSFAIPLPLPITQINHFCFVTGDFNLTADTIGHLFGVPTPIGQRIERSWVWYRGALTAARPVSSLVPISSTAGFTAEIITPDNHPSLWSELLAKQGPTIQHFGLNIPTGTMDATRMALTAAGFPTLQMSQVPTYVCNAYINTIDQL